MNTDQQTIQEWNLSFLEDHLERISHQNKYNDIDPINIVDKELIIELYNELTKPENITLIQNEQYPIIDIKIKHKKTLHIILKGSLLFKLSD